MKLAINEGVTDRSSFSLYISLEIEVMSASSEDLVGLTLEVNDIDEFHFPILFEN